MNGAPFPWQMPQWQRLRQARAAGRLPHALLITGPAGLGKEAFALALARSLLCHAPDPEGRACGHCRSCRFLAADTHPDLRRLEPEEEGKPIKVDAVRELSAWSVLTPQEGALRATVISPADAMNPAAANGLLKTLEEPVKGNHLLLVSSRPAAMPATVRSRCQKVLLTLPDPEQAVDWLENQRSGGAWEKLLRLARGAPLAALQLAGTDALAQRDACFTGFQALCAGAADAADVASAWMEGPTEQIIDWFASWLGDIARLRLGGEPGQLENPDLVAALQQLGAKVDLAPLMKIQERAPAVALAGQRDNLNRQMQVEDLLLEFMEALK